MSWKDLYSEVKAKKMAALGKKDVVKAVEEHGKILAIRGKYEKPEKVIKYSYASVKDIISPSQVPKTNLSKYDVVLIGCPGSEIPKSGMTKFRDYVINDGGWILTTDWCLRTVIDDVFPGFIHWNGEKTDDAVVKCEMVDPHHPFLDGIYGEIVTGQYSTKGSKSPTFSWWLEDKSFPITIIRPELVTVLIRSPEIGKRWGKDPVLVYFDVGKMGGRVIHMISHTHLQKGGKKGHFVSAMILTNILDEKVGIKHGVRKSGGTPQYADYGSTSSSYSSGIEWASPATGSVGQNSYALPESQSQGTTPELFGTAQIVEVIDKNTIPVGQKCALGDGNFVDYVGKVYKCGKCGTLYHENCLNIQLQDGTCKICGSIFLF
ncbi:MAG: hypothetical protein JW776_14780 [Candidatus Lokiarchaeota archaeon]|nr:hypothetical protein [Candidatus Lokiarchaeota archaeon]